MMNRLDAISADQVEVIIRLAEIKAVQEGKNLGGPLEVTLKYEPRPELDRLVAAIEGLPVAAQVELFALKLLGENTSGNDLNRWGEFLLRARQEIPNDLACQMVAKARLHEYLRLGLGMIR